MVKCENCGVEIPNNVALQWKGFSSIFCSYKCACYGCDCGIISTIKVDN